MAEPADGADPDRVVTRADFARALTRLREGAGLTVRDVARAAGTRDSTAGGYFAGRHLPGPRSLPLLAAIVRACGVTDPAEVDRWTAALLRVRRQPGPRPAAAPEPYKGLTAFGPADERWFHGREALTRDLVARVRAPGGRPVVVTGPSGSGKSSLLRAGLVPALRRAGRDVRLVVPGDRPLETLAEPPGDVLVVDQLEELFTLCPDPAERRAVARRLAALAAERPVVLGLRADFWAAAAAEPALVPALQHGQLVVGPMTAEELRRAVTEPARLAGVELEDGLVELVLRDAAAGAGGLPLLSHALLATWRRAARGRLTVADYLASGGIAGALAQTAEDLFQELEPEDRERARRMFLRLVHVGDDTADTRRRVRPEELTAPAVLARYVEQRLVTADADAVEIAHEALLAAWPRLRGWVDADRAGLRVHRRLTDAARAWAEAGRDRHALLRGGALVTAAEWAADPAARAALNPTEREFLAASGAAADRERRAERRRVRRLRALVAVGGVLLVVSGLLAGYLVDQRRAADRDRDAAVSRRVATEADRLRDTDRSLSAQLALAAYRAAPTLEARSALVDASAAVPVTRLLGGVGMLQTVAVTPDGGTVAAGGAGGTVRVWAGSRAVGTLTAATGPGPTVYAVVAGPGRRLATGGSDGQVRLWDLADPARPRRLGAVTGATGPQPTVFALAWAPDGRTLAAGGADGLVRLVDVTRPDRPRVTATLAARTGYVQALAWSPDGRLLVAGTVRGRVHRWLDRRPLGRPLVTGPRAVLAVAVSPDGRTLAAAGKDEQVHLWPARGPARVLSGATSWVNALAFSPDGDTLAAGGSDNAVRLWRPATGRQVTLLPHPGPVTGLAYARGTLLSSAADGAVRLWRLPGPVLPDQPDSVFGVQFTAGGRRLAVAGGAADGAVRFLDVTDPRSPRPTGTPIVGPAGPGTLTGAMAVAPDGGTVATGSQDGTVRLWRGTAPPLVLRWATRTIQSVAFSPAGDRVAASSDDHTVRLWDAAGRRLATFTGATNYVYGIAFDPTGRWLAAGSADAAVRLWDTRSGRLVATLTEPAGYVWAVAFSPDGGTLAAGSADRTVRRWDVRDPTRPVARPPLTGPTNYVFGVQFSRDGRRLAAVSGDRTVWVWAGDELDLRLAAAGDSVLVSDFRPDGAWLAAGTADRTVLLWNLDPEQVADFVCRTAGDPLTRAEWDRYVTGRPYAPPCPRP